MASAIGLKNSQDQEFVLEHPENAGAINLKTNKIMTKSLPSKATPLDNNDIVFVLTSNTTLTIKVKGTDGIVRSANITLV